MSKHAWFSGLKASIQHPSRGQALLLLLLLMGFGGTAQAQPTNGITPRIVGGVDASPTAYPWATALLRSNITDAFYAQFCGGTLIGDRWVLTAAHCVNNLSSPSAIEVSIGIADLQNIGSSERIAVNAIYVHPAYSTSTQDNDIALLELATPSSNTVLDIATDTLTNNIAAGDLMTIIGWGSVTATTPPANPLFPNLLQETQIPLYNFTACDGYYTADGSPLTSNMICAAGSPAGGQDTCQGDSGGPLLYFNTGNTTWYQTGITSFGNGCAEPGIPGVYTRAANYIDWINDTTSIAFPSQYQFGYHGVGRSSATSTLTLRNYSGADITVSAVNLSDPTTNFSLVSESCSTAGNIANDGSCTITLQFLAATVGAQQATLSVDFGTGNTSINTTISGTALASISAAALDETSTRSWYSGGNADWRTDSIANSNGNTAMRSGSISEEQSSALLAYFTGPDVLSFRWKASTEANYDYLNLYIDGVLIDRISGNEDWVQRNINLSAGPHRVAWVYEKDISFSDLGDMVWLDSINTPFSGSTGGVIVSSGGKGGGGSVNLFFLLIVLIALGSAIRQRRARALLTWLQNRSG